MTSENLVGKYDEIFKEHEQNKNIEKVSFDEVPKKPGQVHYFPHRPVLREDKETTKIRAVFDASCAFERLFIFRSKFAFKEILHLTTVSI